MNFDNEKYQIEIIDESNYNPETKDNIVEYKKNHLCESDYRLPTKLGIKIFQNRLEVSSALIGAEGGASAIHKTSQVIEMNRVLICCSNSVFCLDLPTLNLNWTTKVDEATAFQIFKISNGYIIHGELEITRIDNDGNVVWQRGGSDIFVTPHGKNDFEIKDNCIKATDWENRIYKWDLNGNEIK